MGSAPGWMQPLMVIDPLTYGVDALRNAVFSGTMIRIGDESAVPPLQLAHNAGLIRWHLMTDLVAMLATAHRKH